jgi:hypothetical protein
MMVAMKTRRAAARRYLPGSPFNALAPVRPAEAFAVCDQVTHDAYGLGVIVGVEDDAVVVDFRPQQRRIPLPCAKLTKLLAPSAGYVRTRQVVVMPPGTVPPGALIRRGGTAVRPVLRRP